ncbi:MAG: hypothetical protein CMH83_08435 [Nocardioides sp.]|nr:hypothetical protein [Nocardioides sp.]
MPLSEEELRALEQMERALVEEDPKFASTLRGTSIRSAARRRALVAGVAFVGGVAVLMAGAVTQLWYVGVVGFLLMLVSATVALGAVKGRERVPDDPSGVTTAQAHPSGFSVVQGGRKQRRPRGRSSGSSGSFMERMEERWRRRRESGF